MRRDVTGVKIITWRSSIEEDDVVFAVDDHEVGLVVVLVLVAH
jgi:hypothetical protein